MSDTRRVAFCLGATHLGGAERSILDLMSGLPERYEPWAILPRADGPLLALLAERGIQHDVLPMPASVYSLTRQQGYGPQLAQLLRAPLESAPGLAVYLVRLAILLRRGKAELIHSNSIKCHVLAGLTGGLARLPVIWHLRDILESGATLRTLRALQLASRIRVVANSQATARAFDGVAGRVRVIHNGLDAEAFPFAPRPFLRAGPSRPLTVGIVGVLARWKGQLEFLRMAALLLAGGRNLKFVIYGEQIYDTRGEQDYERSLRKEASRLGLDSKVRFAGFEPDPLKAMSTLDILVHASIKPEPFGRVVVEAMACGVPVVASDAGGIPEIIEDGQTGLLVAPGDVRGLASAVERLAGDPPLRERMTREARAEFERRFSLSAHVDAVAAEYGRVLG